LKTECITVQLFIDLCSIYRLLRILARGDRNSCSRCDIVFKPPADSKLTQKRQQPAAAPPTPQLHTPIKVEEKVTLAVSVICVCFFTTALTRFFLFFPFPLFLSYFSHQQPFFFNFCFSEPTFNMNSGFFWGFFFSILVFPSLLLTWTAHRDYFVILNCFIIFSLWFAILYCFEIGNDDNCVM
jgi:hypothetical protein